MITNILANVTITFYCSCKLCCGSNAKGLCANGHPPTQGITIAASRSIPLGTHVRIAGMTNDFIVQDRLAKRFNERVDIYIASHKEALRFGKHTNNISIITLK